MALRLVERARPSALRPVDPGDLVDLAREVPVAERAAGLAGLLDHLGLPRLLRVLVAGAIPPLWYEIAVLHFRGSFQSRYMWLPVAYLPLEMTAGFLAAAVDTAMTRRLFRALSWGTAALGAFGTAMHLRGVRRQMGGFYNWRYNGLTGPPVVAPPQVALFGLIGALGVSGAGTRAVIRRLRLLEVAGQLLLAVEAGYFHYQNYYANRVQYTPVILAPALALVQAAAEGPAGPPRRVGRRLEALLSAVAALAGLVGFGFHVKNVRSRTGGFSWQNLFYGAPLVAPLQLTGQGLLGLLAAYFDRGRG